jgi:serine protease
MSGYHRTVCMLLASACAASVIVGTTSARADFPERKLKLTDVGLPGIDLGLDRFVRLDAIGGRARRLPTGLDELEVYPGRVLVKFKPGASDEGRVAALRSVRAGPSAAIAWGDFEVVSVDPSVDPVEAASQLATRYDVEYAQADYIAIPHYTPNDPLYREQWNLPAINMERAWDINPGASASIVVAVLDSGIAYHNATYRYFAPAFIYEGKRYPALGTVTAPFAAAPDLFGPDRVVAPHDFIWNDDAPVDLSGHGTHVAGTIGQLTNNSVGVAGMAFNVRIMPVKVLADQWDLIFDCPNVGTSSIVAAGIRYAADNGARIINMSLGFSGPSTLPVIEEALRYAVGRGVFVTVSAGNDFEDGNPVEPLAEIANRLQGVISVGAVGRDLNRAYYSSKRSSVEIVAPGGDFRQGGSAGGILQQTLDPGLSISDPLDRPVSQYGAPRFDVFRYVYYQGTSMSAPHVAGFGALLMQQGITDPAAIEAAITKYATDRGPAGRDDEYGFGLINPRNTLRGLGLAR